MSKCAPGSQSRTLMAEKEHLAMRMLGQGLTIAQICKQLRCSPQFVRQAREKMSQTVQAAS